MDPPNNQPHSSTSSPIPNSLTNDSPPKTELTSNEPHRTKLRKDGQPDKRYHNKTLQQNNNDTNPRKRKSDQLSTSQENLNTHENTAPHLKMAKPNSNQPNPDRNLIT